MKAIQIEEFGVSETSPATGLGEFADPVAAERFKVLAEKNGLKGQIALLQKVQIATVVDPDAKPDEFVPTFRQMTREELFVWQAVLPTKTDIASYRGEPMPLRVLEILDREKPRWFAMEIWSPAPGSIDPLLVGYDRASYGNYRGEPHAIVRWGESLVPFADLTRKALVEFKVKSIRALKLAMDTVKRDLATAEGIDPNDSVVPIDTSAPEFRGWSS